MVIKRIVKSEEKNDKEVLLKIKQSRKGGRIPEPIIASVRIGQPKKRMGQQVRGATIQERTGKTILPAGQSQIAQGLALGLNRPSDFSVIASLRNVEEQNRATSRAIEEQNKKNMEVQNDLRAQLYRIGEQTRLIESERAGLRRVRNMETGEESIYEPTVATVAGESIFRRNIEKWLGSNSSAPSVASSRESRRTSLLSEPVDIPDIPQAVEVAGADVTLPSPIEPPRPMIIRLSELSPEVRERQRLAKERLDELARLGY